MNRFRGFRGYRSLSSFTPPTRASERLKKTGRYSGTSVLAGRKHKKTPFSFRRKLSRLHTRYDIPYTHTHNSTGGIHKPTVLPIRRKRSSAFTYHNTISTHTEGIHKTHNMYNTTQYTPYIHSQHNTKGIYKPHNIYIKRKGTLTYHRTASTHIPYNIPFTRTHDYLRPIHTHTNARLTTYKQPSQPPLWIPMHGFLVAGRGIEQVNESPGLIPPRVQGIHKPTVLPIRRKRSSVFTYHNTISTHTPYNIPYTCTQRIYTHCHRHNNRKGSAKAQTYTHHIRHTPTHTRQTVSEGFAFTHPRQGTHKHTWFNKPHERMRFMGWSDKSHEPSSTGVMHTNRPWFRRILAFRGEGRAGARVEHDRYRKRAQITEDRHKGWCNTDELATTTDRPGTEQLDGNKLPGGDQSVGKGNLSGTGTSIPEL
jgi:hypothetical protein